MLENINFVQTCGVHYWEMKAFLYTAHVFFQAYLSRDEAQAQIARSLAEKDVLRGQLMELQEKVFTMKACSRQRERREKSRVKLNFCLL